MINIRHDKNNPFNSGILIKKRFYNTLLFIAIIFRQVGIAIIISIGFYYNLIYTKINTLIFITKFVICITIYIIYIYFLYCLCLFINIWCMFAGNSLYYIEGCVIKNTITSMNIDFTHKTNTKNYTISS